MMRRWSFLLVLLLAHSTAWAHKASDSYLMLNARGADIRIQWDIALRDIDFALGLDQDGNAEITWGELRAQQANLSAWALSRLLISRGGNCPLALRNLQVDDHTDGGYAVLHISGNCPSASAELELQYRLLFDLDNLHRGLLNLTLDGNTHSAVLSPSSGKLAFSTARVSRWSQFKQYVLEGIGHIWMGYDHILFLLSLLLPAVLRVQRQSRVGVARFNQAWPEVLWVVSSFTAAHSVTLSLAALGLISLPSRLVESAIALSVALAAANNLWPRVHGRRWLVAFGFGLIHGFGFASVLAELGLPADALALSLLGFNAGVELGQIAIVAGFLPLAFVLRNTRFYQRGVLVLGSWLTLLLASLWFLERAFHLKLLSV